MMRLTRMQACSADIRHASMPQAGHKGHTRCVDRRRLAAMNRRTKIYSVTFLLSLAMLSRATKAPAHAKDACSLVAAADGDAS
jgi:hypothetical protein